MNLEFDVITKQLFSLQFFFWILWVAFISWKTSPADQGLPLTIEAVARTRVFFKLNLTKMVLFWSTALLCGAGVTIFFLAGHGRYSFVLVPVLLCFLWLAAIVAVYLGTLIWSWQNRRMLRSS